MRLLLVGVMLASLVMSATLPEAFDERGLGFASAYVMIQVGRTVVVLLLLGRDHQLTRTSGGCSPGWCSPACFGPGACPRRGAGRACGWWRCAGLHRSAARLLDGGVGRSRTEEWTIEGRHLAERYQPFVIVALGESILLTGATFADLDPSAGTVTAFVVAFAAA